VGCAKAPACSKVQLQRCVPVLSVPPPLPSSIPPTRPHTCSGGTTALLLAGAALAWGLPDLANVIDLVCSFSDSILMFVLPSGLWLWVAVHRGRGPRPHPAHLAACSALLLLGVCLFARKALDVAGALL
jgi:hypothetical protein